MNKVIVLDIDKDTLENKLDVLIPGIYENEKTGQLQAPIENVTRKHIAKLYGNCTLTYRSETC